MDRSQWRRVAVVEIASDTSDFEQLIVDETLQYRLRHAKVAPHGRLWYEIFVSAVDGERGTARTAWAILSRLQRTAEGGFLRGFRIVAGRHWLKPGSEPRLAHDHDRDIESERAASR